MSQPQKQVSQPNSASSWYLPGIFIGLIVTIKNLIANLFNKNRMQTLNYPEEKYEYSPRFRGTHVLTVRDDGSIRCTACMLCVTNCPANCITIVAGEHQDPTVEKYPVVYEIDMLRCIFCGYCEEACPVDAVRMGPEWQIPGENGSNFIYGIQELAYRPQLKGGIKSIVDDKERSKLI